ncbi:arginyl-tRNA--protein transferase 1-like [Eutrema salsugineum]|uniref:arginyl-tRNA--protein transferase 1-like n=1 Tax=Eutrema salsugineum TaxID=72664 RepID=UPI000CED468E|nr:arginyl-tRNA--protein transferase 1-like [Eutrema salsugineum]
MGSDPESCDDTDDMDQTDEYDSEDDFIDDGESCEGSGGSSDNSEGDSGDDEDEDDDDADSADDNEDDDEDIMLDDETEIDDDSEDQRNVEPSDILIEKNISISGHQNSVLQTWMHMLISKRYSMELILSDEQGFKIQATVRDGEIGVASSRIDVGTLDFKPELPFQGIFCLVSTDFHVMEMRKDETKPLMFGTSFLASVETLINYPNQKMCLSKINRKTSHPAIPTRNSHCIIIDSVDDPIFDPGGATKDVGY